MKGYLLPAPFVLMEFAYRKQIRISAFVYESFTNQFGYALFDNVGIQSFFLQFVPYFALTMFLSGAIPLGIFQSLGKCVQVLLRHSHSFFCKVSNKSQLIGVQSV